MFFQNKKGFYGKTRQGLLFAQFVMKDGRIRNMIINSVGVADYVIEHKLYYFVDESDKKSWVVNYYGRRKDMIYSQAD